MYSFFSLWKAVLQRFVAYIRVIWTRVDSCLLGNHSNNKLKIIHIYSCMDLYIYGHIFKLTSLNSIPLSMCSWIYVAKVIDDITKDRAKYMGNKSFCPSPNQKRGNVRNIAIPTSIYIYMNKKAIYFEYLNLF